MQWEHHFAYFTQYRSFPPTRTHTFTLTTRTRLNVNAYRDIRDKYQFLMCQKVVFQNGANSEARHVRKHVIVTWKNQYCAVRKNKFIYGVSSRVDSSLAICVSFQMRNAKEHWQIYRLTRFLPTDSFSDCPRTNQCFLPDIPGKPKNIPVFASQLITQFPWRPTEANVRCCASGVFVWTRVTTAFSEDFSQWHQREWATHFNESHRKVPGFCPTLHVDIIIMSIWKT